MKKYQEYDKLNYYLTLIFFRLSLSTDKFITCPCLKKVN